LNSIDLSDIGHIEFTLGHQGFPGFFSNARQPPYSFPTCVSAPWIARIRAWCKVFARRLQWHRWQTCGSSFACPSCCVRCTPSRLTPFAQRLKKGQKPHYPNGLPSITLRGDRRAETPIQESRHAMGMVSLWSFWAHSFSVNCWLETA